jgi:hypothetical protein
MQRIFAPPFEGSSLLKEAQKSVQNDKAIELSYCINRLTFASALKLTKHLKKPVYWWTFINVL